MFSCSGPPCCFVDEEKAKQDPSYYLKNTNAETRETLQELYREFKGDEVLAATMKVPEKKKVDKLNAVSRWRAAQLPAQPPCLSEWFWDTFGGEATGSSRTEVPLGARRIAVLRRLGLTDRCAGATQGRWPLPWRVCIVLWPKLGSWEGTCWVASCLVALVVLRDIASGSRSVGGREGMSLGVQSH